MSTISRNKDVHYCDRSRNPISREPECHMVIAEIWSIQLFCRPRGSSSAFFRRQSSIDLSDRSALLTSAFLGLTAPIFSDFRNGLREDPR